MGGGERALGKEKVTKRQAEGTKRITKEFKSLTEIRKKKGKPNISWHRTKESCAVNPGFLKKEKKIKKRKAGHGRGRVSDDCQITAAECAPWRAPPFQGGSVRFGFSVGKV